MLFNSDIRPEAHKILEYRNLRRQHKYLLDITTLSNKHLPASRLSAQFIKDLNQIATAGLCENPGQYRTEPARINNSQHQPIHPNEIADEIGNLCVFVKENWNRYDPFTLASYVLWRLVWIHPFEDGNGRTADAVSYFILCRKLESWLPGKNIIPTYWHDNRDDRYYAALKAADAKNENSPKSVSQLSTLMKRALMNQLKSANL